MISLDVKVSAMARSRHWKCHHRTAAWLWAAKWDGVRQALGSRCGGCALKMWSTGELPSPSTYGPAALEAPPPFTIDFHLNSKAVTEFSRIWAIDCEAIIFFKQPPHAQVCPVPT